MNIAKKLAKLDAGALAEGMKNYHKPDKEVDKLAEERAETCKGCDYLEDEPISFLRVKDERIPAMSGKMCGDCGCILPYKLRQSKKICKFWDQ